MSLDILANAIAEFRKYKTMGDKCIARLSDEELYFQLDEESNSLAIIIRHMYGNMKSRWTDFLTSDGEKPDRNRDTEFEDLNETKAELQAKWDAGWQILFDSLTPLNDDDLGRTIYIRQEAHTVLQAIIRQISHYAYHVGQMVFLAKQIKSSDWQSLSIPKGKSAEFNQQMMK